MKTRVSKKALSEAQIIVDKFGYWSEEYLNFVSQYRGDARQKIHNSVKR